VPFRHRTIDLGDHMKTHTLASYAAALALASCSATSALDAPASLAEATAEPLTAIDEVGNAKYLGTATRTRCAAHLALEGAKTYELGHVYSSTMPQSPFADAPVAIGYKASQGLPYTAHIANGETGGAIGSQGTQFDALGHFGSLPGPWIAGAGPLPSASAMYFGGLTQAQVKPTDASPLLHLGIEHVAPILTTVVVLDAKALHGSSLPAGYSISVAEVQQMLARQGLTRRGILPGDAVFIRTGWGEKWQDPNPPQGEYYTGGPGLSVQADLWLAEKKIVLLGLDNPFTDPAAPCLLNGTCAPGPETLPGLPFSDHHTNLSVKGIHQIQNLDLTKIADDRVNVACAIVLPLRIQGAAGSPIRPVAVGRSRD
jgi:kynurenine formamidase